MLHGKRAGCKINQESRSILCEKQFLSFDKEAKENKNMFDTARIAQKIKEARIARNMTQMNLADAMEVSYQAVSNWERGNSMPDIAKLG